MKREIQDLLNDVKTQLGKVTAASRIPSDPEKFFKMLHTLSAKGVQASRSGKFEQAEKLADEMSQMLGAAGQMDLFRDAADALSLEQRRG